MSEYSQTYGSFERTGNYPLEADLIFNSYSELEEWASNHLEILHEGLFKIVLENGELKLYWAEADGDNIVFKEYQSGAELELDVTATNVTVGNITNGTKFNAGTTFTQFVLKMLVKPTRPTYSLSGIASTTPIEVGTAVTNAIGIYVPNLGGPASNATATVTAGFIDVQYNQNNIVSNNKVNIYLAGRIAEGNNTLSSTVTYQASILFPEITASSVTATRTIVGARKYFRGNGMAPTTNSGIRNSTSSLASASVTYALNAGQTSLWIAIPANKTLSSVTDAGALNAVITDNFVKTNTIKIDGATAGKDAIDYSVYLMTGYGPFGSAHNLTFNII